LEDCAALIALGEAGQFAEIDVIAAAFGEIGSGPAFDRGQSGRGRQFPAGHDRDGRDYEDRCHDCDETLYQTRLLRPLNAT